MVAVGADCPKTVTGNGDEAPDGAILFSKTLLCHTVTRFPAQAGPHRITRTYQHRRFNNDFLFRLI